MTSKFKYRERSAETVSARSKQSGGNYDSYMSSAVTFLKVKEGQNDIRILPPTWDIEGPWGDNWGIEVYIHRDIGPDKGAYLCLDQMRDKYGSKAVPAKLGACPLCAARHDLADGDEEAQKALKPGKQILAYVINRDDEKAGPQIWRLGWQLERDIQIRSQDKKTGAVIALDDPDHGFDVSFTREGTGLKTKYVGVDIARDESPLHDKPVRQDKWLDFVVDNALPEQLVFHDADYLEQVYMGKRGAKGGSAVDEEEDDRPKRTARRPDPDEDEEPAPRRTARKPQADEEEDERPRAGRHAAEDYDAGDDVAPRRRKAAVAEDPDEEDAPPPRKRSAAAEPDEEEDRPRRTARRPDPDDDDDLPNDAQMARNAAKLRKRPDPDEDEDDAPPPKRTAKKAAMVEDEDEDEPVNRKAGGKPVDRAKASLERLKPNRSK